MSITNVIPISTDHEGLLLPSAIGYIYKPDPIIAMNIMNPLAFPGVPTIAKRKDAISSKWAAGVALSIMCANGITMLCDCVSGRGRD